MSFLLNLAELTLTMSALIAAMLMLSKLFGRRFSAKCRYIVWTIIIIRLCVPIGVFDLPTLLTIEVPAAVYSEAEQPSFDYSEPMPGKGNENGIIAPDGGEQADEESKNEEIDVEGNSSTTSGDLDYSAEISAFDKIMSLFSIDVLILCAWAVVALAYFSASFVYSVLVTQRYKRKRELCDENTQRVYRELCERENIKRAPALYICESVESPLLFGFVRPTILLPRLELNEELLKGVLSHELIHHKRRDIWVKLICLAAQAINWFNPLVHIAAKCCNSEMELSCDEKVLAIASENERRTYGEAMLEIVKNCSSKRRAVLTTSFNPKENAVKERILNILDLTKKRRGLSIISLALVLAVVAGFVLGCEVKKDSTKDGEKENYESESLVIDAQTEADTSMQPESETDAETDVETDAETDISTEVQTEIETQLAGDSEISSGANWPETAVENSGNVHLEHSEVLINVVNASCTEDGYSGDLVCKDCGKVLYAGETTLAYHKYKLQTIEKMASCTEDGYKKDGYCPECNTVVSGYDSVVYPKFGHYFIDRFATKTPTSTEDGYVSRRECEHCGEQEYPIILPKIPYVEELTGVVEAETYIFEKLQEFRFQHSKYETLERNEKIYVSTKYRADFMAYVDKYSLAGDLNYQYDETYTFLSVFFREYGMLPDRDNTVSSKHYEFTCVVNDLDGAVDILISDSFFKHCITNTKMGASVAVVKGVNGYYVSVILRSDSYQV